jgi:anaphase-promoting complex subunit 10
MKVYLDFDLDESYTPTKMTFFAGISEGGLVESAAWEVQEHVDPETGESTSGVENVRGWTDTSLRGVGGRDTNYHGTDLTPKPKKPGKSPPLSTNSRTPEDILAAAEGHADEDDIQAAAGGNVLKCMVVQVRICENHQNGKTPTSGAFKSLQETKMLAREAERSSRRASCVAKRTMLRMAVLATRKKKRKKSLVWRKRTGWVSLRYCEDKRCVFY